MLISAQPSTNPPKMVQNRRIKHTHTHKETKTDTHRLNSDVQNVRSEIQDVKFNLLMKFNSIIDASRYITQKTTVNFFSTF